MRFLLDKSYYDGTYQIVDTEENVTWGRFKEDEEPQLQTTVDLLNKLDSNVKMNELLLMKAQDRLDDTRSRIVYAEKYGY